MSVYFDASVLVSLFVDDRSTEAARAFIRRGAPQALVSDFAAAEFASSISRLVRMRLMTPREGTSLFVAFDEWRADATQELSMQSQDVEAAAVLLRSFETPLRTPDMLHVVMAKRANAALATFDLRLRESADRLGFELALL